jgi:tetratricopeptide (TPR) repeat protein
MKVSFDEAVMASIEKNTQVNPGNYTTAANYYLNNGKDLNKALEWMNMYLAVGENGKQFWHVHTKAKILAKMGNKKEAIATAKASLELAKNSERGDFGYIKNNEDLIASLK